MDTFRPLFIFGVARSGTNLIARMVSMHDSVVIALDPLMPLFRAWRNAILESNPPSGGWSDFDSNSAFQDYYFHPQAPAMLETVLGGDMEHIVPPALLDPLRDQVVARASLEMPQLADKFKSWDGRTIHDLFDGAYAIIADSLGAGATITYVGCKELWVVEYASALARAYPDARFISLHRDPRGVLASLLKMASGQADQAAHTISYLRHWRKHVAVSLTLEDQPLLEGRFLNVRYEDLASSPRKIAQQVCEFLELQFDEKVLTPKAADGTAWEGNSSYGRVGALIDPIGIDRWRQHLSPTMIDTIEFHCGPEMLLLDYPLMSEGLNGRLTSEVIDEIEKAHANPGSWRSDSGDPMSDLGYELLRTALLSLNLRNDDETLVRRCFLFPWVFDKSKRH